MDHSLLAEFSPSEYKPGRTQKTDDDLVEAAGDVATTIFHPVGTAKMGLDTDDEAVVSGKLGVHGVRDLYIADASVVPINQWEYSRPVVMIAERLAEWLDNSIISVEPKSFRRLSNRGIPVALPSKSLSRSPWVSANWSIYFLVSSKYSPVFGSIPSPHRASQNQTTHCLYQ